MDTNKWKSMSIRKEIIDVARKIGIEIERSIGNALTLNN